MSTEPSGQIADMQGELALPRSNGELVFAAPWEGRAFGIAVALNESGAYEWGEFQGRLAEEIASAPRDEDASCIMNAGWHRLRGYCSTKAWLRAKI